MLIGLAAHRGEVDRIQAHLARKARDQRLAHRPPHRLEDVRGGIIVRLQVGISEPFQEFGDRRECRAIRRFDRHDRHMRAQRLFGALQHRDVHALDVNLDQYRRGGQLDRVQRPDRDRAFADFHTRRAEIVFAAGILDCADAVGLAKRHFLYAHQLFQAVDGDIRVQQRGRRRIWFKGDDARAAHAREEERVIADIGAHVESQIARLEESGKRFEKLALVERP